MNDRTVLISGAGIAGPTLAYWLARRGYRCTVVERAAALRSSGSPVDVRGRAVEVVERMGVMPRVRDAGTAVTELVFVDDRGRRAGRLATQGRGGGREVELPRGDLAAILLEASRDHAEYVFHDAITALREDGGGVEVEFERGRPRRFDLVFGADGLHSAVRRLAFGPESSFVQPLGMFVATVPLAGAVEPPRQVVMYNTPGRAVAVHPARGRAIAAFMFRSAAVAQGFDHRDAAQHKRLVAEAYADAGWRVPELLAHVRTSDDLYFDAVSRVRLVSWSRGRVALLGDAASCLSLFGDGSSLAIAGAFTLAEALAERPDDHPRAFREYEARHRVLVDPKGRAFTTAAALLVPATRGGIAVRNLAMRLWTLGGAGNVRRGADRPPHMGGHAH
ncbi:FAD-dependent monooxygenase [Sorangium sp. So ce321]|uniref:FAD-dependent monooxygenase n=1 Tax=Sorangium sp. So ce321 TaxID=3133300 RepID=UPI003F63168C